MTRLILARHGNVFEAGDMPTRVGARTDKPLSSRGEQEAHDLGLALKSAHLVPDVVFASHLKRAQDTARLALEAADLHLPVTLDSSFNEIDYGPDENKPENDVIARLGQDALDAWNKNATVPDGWHVDPRALIQHWKAFAQRCEHNYAGQTILVVSSNGILRFSPHLTGDFDAFSHSHSLKVAPGAFCVFEKETSDPVWSVKAWNVKSL